LPGLRLNSKYINQASFKSKTQKACVGNGFITGLKGSVELDERTTWHMGKRLSKTSNILCKLHLYIRDNLWSHIKRCPNLGAKGCLSHSLPLYAPHSLTHSHEGWLPLKPLTLNPICPLGTPLPCLAMQDIPLPYTIIKKGP